MKFNPNPNQTFLVLSMLFGDTAEEREPAFKKAGLEPKFRKPLEDAGVVRVEKRGRTSHLLLTEEAWEFASEHLDSELPKTPRAGKVLRAVLSRLRHSLETNEVSLADFVNGTPAPVDAVPNQPVVNSSEAQIRAACLALAHGETRKRVLLKDLRPALGISKDELDRTLLALQTAGRLVLYKLDNPAEITADDEKAALFIAGQPRHIVYLEA